MLAARVEPRVLREKRISSIGAGVELEIGDKGFSGSFSHNLLRETRAVLLLRRDTIDELARAGHVTACAISC